MSSLKEAIFGAVRKLFTVSGNVNETIAIGPQNHNEAFSHKLNAFTLFGSCLMLCTITFDFFAG